MHEHGSSTSTGQYYYAPGASTRRNEEAKSAQACRFFLQGTCNKGKDCRYSHPATTTTLNLQPAKSDATSVDIESPQSPSDSRATVSCWFLSKPGGCQNSSCPYLHVADEHNTPESSRVLEANEEEASHLYLVPVRIEVDPIGRAKSMKTTSFGLFQERQSTSMK
jgi:hypothetical protein